MDATTGALIVAGLSVLMTPVTAWLTFRWGRDQERDRWKSEREADAERWKREERKRRQLRGEDAALRLLEVVDEAAIAFGNWQGSKQSEMKPTYHEVRRLAELLTDDATRDKMFRVADAIYYYNAAEEAAPDLSQHSVGYTFSEAAHAVIRAYLHERPFPETRRFDRLVGLIEKGGELIAEQLGEDELRDPLDEPETSGD